MTPKDLSPYLFDFVPDPEAVQGAAQFAAALPPAPMQDVHNFVMCFASFHNDHAGPGLPEGLSEAVGVLAFAASGLFTILQAAGHEEGEDLALTRLKDWRTLAHAQLWARSEYRRLSAGFSGDETEGLTIAVNNPHLLPRWAEDMRQAGRIREAARFAVWQAVAHLLDAAPMLEDGEAEDLTATLLAAFTPGAAPWPAHAAPQPLTLSPSPEDVPGLSDFVPTVEAVEELGQGVARIRTTDGPAGYLTRRENCTITPLPDGAYLLTLSPGTLAAIVCRLPAILMPAFRKAVKWLDEAEHNPPNLSLN